MDKNLRKWIKINNFIESQIGASPSSIIIDHTEEGRARSRQRGFHEAMIGLLTTMIISIALIVVLSILARGYSK